MLLVLAALLTQDITWQPATPRQSPVLRGTPGCRSPASCCGDRLGKWVVQYRLKNQSTTITTMVSGDSGLRMRVTTRTLRTTSALVRPASTAERAIGRERKRSMSPVPRSVASPTPVLMAPKATTWAKMPGIR